MEWIFNSEIWMALITLTALEIVLGIDNIIFITILSGRLPVHQQSKGRKIGLLMAMFTRIALLFSLTLIMRLTDPLFSVFAKEISGRDLILIAGGLFLLGKSTVEIHANLEGESHQESTQTAKTSVSFMGVIIQIMILDIVFSLDSVITAIGLTDKLPVMIVAIVCAVIVMLALAESLSRFVENHPTIKILALSFLLLIGMALVGEGLEMHIPKGYVYFAMAFSLFVEMLNMKTRLNRRVSIKQQHTYAKSPQPENR